MPLRRVIPGQLQLQILLILGFCVQVKRTVRLITEQHTMYVRNITYLIPLYDRTVSRIYWHCFSSVMRPSRRAVVLRV